MPRRSLKRSSEPSTADELTDAAAALVKWLEDMGHRDNALVVKAKDIIDRFK